MSSSDYSILAMLQRRMARAASRREPFPRDAEALRQRLARTREALRRCLGTMPEEVISPRTRVEASVPLAGAGAIAARLTQHDVTEEFGGRVIEWLDRHMFEVREGSHASALAR
jgi:hypothetical protein